MRALVWRSFDSGEAFAVLAHELQDNELWVFDLALIDFDRRRSQIHALKGQLLKAIGEGGRQKNAGVTVGNEFRQASTSKHVERHCLVMALGYVRGISFTPVLVHSVFLLARKCLNPTIPFLAAQGELFLGRLSRNDNPASIAVIIANLILELDVELKE
jgi:hypothetical protein